MDLSDDTIGAVTDIANRLDGLPLALELAAARLSVLGVAGLVTRLDSQLAVLAGPAGTDARHATLRATIDWWPQQITRVTPDRWRVISSRQRKPHRQEQGLKERDWVGSRRRAKSVL